MNLKKLFALLLALVAATTLAACKSGGDGGSPPPATTYSISGTVTENSVGVSGITVTLSGSANASVITNASGSYSFTGLANGSYTITPSGGVYTYAPASQNITISGANVANVNFMATAPGTTYSISGTVTLNSAGLPGIAVILNSTTTVTTDGSGNYSFSGLSDGVYTVTPSNAGYTFTPVNRVITVTGANVTVANFAATAVAATYSLVGRVTVTGTATGLQGVTMTLNTLATTNTDTNGDYAFTLLSNGSYTVTPSHSDYTFTPASRNQAISGGDATGVDFIAMPIPDPARAVVKFSTSPTVTLIGAIDIVVALPTGATLKTTGSSTVDPTSAYASGNGATSALFLATYTAASGTFPGTTHGMLGSTAGFASGEFMTIVADLTGGVRPAASDFVVKSLSVYDIDTQPINGLTATASVTLQGGGTPTKGRLKLMTSGTTTTITGVDVTIKLPAGVSIANTQNPPETDPGVVFASGNAISNSLVAGNYDTVNQTLQIGLINLYGFAPGEFATVMCDLSGVTPVSTDFQIQSATLYSLYSSTSITGTVDRTLTLE